MPEGRRLLPLITNASFAPSSTVILPFIRAPKAIHLFFPTILIFLDKNFVPGFSPSSILPTMPSFNPFTIKVVIPLTVAIFAALNLVCIPPVPRQSSVPSALSSK